MNPSTSTIERLAWGLLVASLGLAQFKLLGAQVLFGLSAVLWLALVVRQRTVGPLPAFTWALAAYAGLTLLSAALSAQPRASLIDCKQLVLFLLVPMTVRLLRGSRALSALNVIIAIGAVGALIGIVESTMLGFDNLQHRPMGSLSHYMTYSGVIMLVLTATVARLLFYPAQRLWPAIAVPALAVALALTFTRNAWIGAVAAATCLLALRHVKLMLIVPAVLIAFVALAPGGVRARALSMFDTREESNRDRLQMAVMGWHIVQDHPLAGVGPDMIKNVYAEYRPPDAVHPSNPHLHNVPVQIAAERGLPALAAWLTFIGILVFDLFRQVRRGPHQALAAAGLGAIVAMLTAGLFEYNFGDSEFLMLFLGLVSLPYAARVDVGSQGVAAPAMRSSRPR